MTLRRPDFPYFPHRIWRNTPDALEYNLPSTTVDPWARRDAWRYDTFFSTKRRLAAMFPGLGIATVAFGVYVAYDQWYTRYGPGKLSKQDHHH